MINNLFIPQFYYVDYLKRGGKSIKIKESNKGLFTKYCNGKVTEDCIKKGKNSPDPKIRKRATFAANVRKWGKGGNTLEEIDARFPGFAQRRHSRMRKFGKSYIALKIETFTI